MKDAYSFHANIEDFEEFYENIKQVYMRVFDRLGIGADTVIADADGGAISDKNSHEFQTFLSIGEDIIVQDSSGYSFNLELASGVADEKNTSEEKRKMEYINTVEDIVTMEKMMAYFGSPAWQMLKTVVYKTNSGRFFSIVIRGDLAVNEIKVRKFIQKKYNEGFVQATEEDLILLGTVRGFATPIRDAKLKIENYGDESLMSAKNYYG